MTYYLDVRQQASQSGVELSGNSHVQNAKLGLEMNTTSEISVTGLNNQTEY